MSSYFVNSLFSKYKTGESLRPNYYDCGFAQDLGGRPTVVYGPSSGGSFQHPSQIQEFYHGPSSLSTAPYQQNPCAVACHGDPGNFYGYDPLQRQSLFGAQDRSQTKDNRGLRQRQAVWTISRCHALPVASRQTGQAVGEQEFSPPW